MGFEKVIVALGVTACSKFVKEINTIPIILVIIFICLD
jgi:hypothetical protein